MYVLIIYLHRVEWTQDDLFVDIFTFICYRNFPGEMETTLCSTQKWTPYPRDMKIKPDIQRKFCIV